MKQYSAKDFEQLSNGYNKILGNTEDKKYNRALVFTILKNMKNMSQELEIIKDMFKDDDEKFIEYISKIQEKAVEHGAERKQQGNRSIVDIDVEGFEKEAFEKAQKKMEKEYSDAIKRQEEIIKHNNEERSRKYSDLTLKPLKLSWFPKEISTSDIPFELIDLIEE